MFKKDGLDNSITKFAIQVLKVNETLAMQALTTHLHGEKVSVEFTSPRKHCKHLNLQRNGDSTSQSARVLDLLSPTMI